MGEYTKEDYATPAPYEELYEMRSDSLAHTLKLEDMSMKAANVGFRGFKRVYKEFVESKKAARNTYYINSKTQFDGQEMELECGAWEADELGVRQRTMMGDVVACVHPIMPVKRLVNLETGEVKIELAYRLGDEWRKTIVEKKTISSASTIVGLSALGIAVNSENAKALVRWLHDAEYNNFEMLPVQHTISRLGYVEGGTKFIPYSEGVLFDGQYALAPMFDAVKPCGQYDAWKRCVKAMRARTLAARLAVSASFASVLIEPMNLLSFFLHLWSGTPGIGKTVALAAATSVWANPQKGRYWQTFNSTTVGAERMAGFLHNLPVVLDELQLAREKGRQDFNVYRLAEGTGKLRGTKHGGIDLTPTWANCIITSGESPLVRATDGGGAMLRVIDLDCGDQLIVENGAETMKILCSNYGMAGKDFVERLLSDPTIIEATQNEWRRIYGELGANGKNDKQCASLALIAATDGLVNEWIFDGEEEPLPSSAIRDLIRANTEIDVNERAYSYICDWIAENVNKFNENNKTGDVYGVIDVSEYQTQGIVCIIRSVFNRVIEDAGYSVAVFLPWLKKNGYLTVRADGRGYTRARRIKNYITECVCIKTAIDGEEWEEIDSEAPF